MTTPTNMQGYGLTKNPFPLEPTSSVVNWAGMDREKNLLQDIVSSPLSTDIGASEFVIIHGEYGTGKSHALRYFSTLINNDDKDRFNAIVAYMPTVKLDARISFVRLYKEIIGSIGIDRLTAKAQIISNSFDAEKDEVKSRLTMEELRERAGEEQQLSERVLQSVEDADRAMLKLMLLLANRNDDAARYLMGESVHLPENIGLTGPVNSDYMASKTLGSLFRVLNLRIGEQQSACNATYLFLDEVESALEDRQADLQQFFQSIRELVNELPYNFCLLLAFSADAALLEAVLPRAVLERMTRGYLELRSLTVDEAKDFIGSQLQQHRPDGFVNPNRFHPFMEETVEVCLEHIVEMTPRRLFRTLYNVLVRAIRKEDLIPGQEITAEVAQSILTTGGY